MMIPMSLLPMVIFCLFFSFFIIVCEKHSKPQIVSTGVRERPGGHEFVGHEFVGHELSPADGTSSLNPKP